MTTSAPGSRVRYAEDLLRELFPGATVRCDGIGERVWALAPSVRHPRLLVPTSPGGAAAVALRSYGGRMTRAARLGYAAAAAGLAVAGARPLRARLAVTGGDDGRRPGIDDHLAAAYGDRVALAFHLTPPRANRKPIIQVLTAGEPHPVGFAKVGVDALTSRLVRQEAAALSALEQRGLTRITTPAVVVADEFAGLDVLAMRPLPTWLSGQAPGLEQSAPAARELAGDSQTSALRDSGYWRGLRSHATALSPSLRADLLRECLDRLEAVAGSTELAFTASHGDWSPWNMWLTATGLLVWDWERFETETPAGLDLLHFRLQDQVVRGAWPQQVAAQRLLAEAAEIANLAGSPDPPLLSAVLYLLHLAARYEADGQAEAGAALGRTETWLLPVVAACLDDPTLTKRT